MGNAVGLSKVTNKCNHDIHLTNTDNGGTKQVVVRHGCLPQNVYAALGNWPWVESQGDLENQSITIRHTHETGEAMFLVWQEKGNHYFCRQSSSDYGTKRSLAAKDQALSPWRSIQTK